MPSRVPHRRVAGPREGVWLSHITRKDKSPGDTYYGVLPVKWTGKKIKIFIAARN